MEKIYPVSYFDCTEKLVHLKEYFKSYLELSDFIKEDELDLSKEELIRTKLTSLFDDQEGVPNTSTMCSIDSLTCPGEVNQIEVYNFTRYTMKIHRDYGVSEDAKKLETIKAKMQYGNVAPRKKEFDNIALKPNKVAVHNMTLDNTLVFVRIYQPYSAVLEKKLMRRGEKLKCSYEIVALMSNMLSELRDKIVCANDNGLSLEIDDLKTKAVHNVKDEYPSALIGIDDVLYIDMRRSKAIDYSQVIQRWGVQKNVANFKVLQMDQVRIEDLTFRLGYPYIYQHRGNCEHLVTFTDVRLIKRSDPLCISDYPYYRNINRYNSEQCNICHSIAANWVCCECDRLPHNRTFLCQECFVSYNYLDSQKIGSFKAYPYYNRTSVM